MPNRICGVVELQRGGRIVIGPRRPTGRTVAVIAGNPLRGGGRLDSLSAGKAPRSAWMRDAL